MKNWGEQFEALAGPRYPALLAYARLVCSDPDEAQDLVQDALVSTFGTLRRFESSYAAEAYVRRAIVSRFIDGHRKAAVRKRALEAFRSQPSPTSAPGADAALDLHPSSGVDRALATLSPRERAVVVLRHVDALSTRETAAALGVSEGAVKRYLADAVAKLQQTLDFRDTETAPIKEVTTP